MNTRFSALLIGGLAGLMLSGPTLANPLFTDSGFTQFSVRDGRTERDSGQQEEREMRKAGQQQGQHDERRDGRKAEDHEPERGYGYGYERRNRQSPGGGRGRR